MYRYPKLDHQKLPFPKEIAMFGLPMGAVIESWPKIVNSDTLKKPVFSTFIINVNSDDDGSIHEKVYGSTLTFYEEIDISKLITKQKNLLNLSLEELIKENRTYHSNKALVILSRFPFYNAFKDFLLFLFNKYCKMNGSSNFENIPIERYLSFLIYEIPFPTPQKPKILINLTEKEEDCVSISLPNECQLPQSLVN